MEEPPAPDLFRVEVAGLVLEVWATSVTDQALIRRVVGHGSTTRPADARLTIDRTGPAVPETAPDFAAGFGEHWDDGTVHSYRHPWGFSARMTDRAAVMGGTAEGFERWATVRACMFFVIARLMAAEGRFLVHGGAVRKGDAGILVIGDSGTGKSSLAFAAHRAGWSVLADDMAVVDARGSLLEVQGIPRVPAVPGDVALDVDAASEAMPDDARERIELVGLDLDLRPAPIVATVVTGHDDGRGRLAPLTTAHALQRLVPALVLSSLPRPVKAWFPHAAALARGYCVELRHAARPTERLFRAAELLDQILDDVAARPSAQDA